MCVRFFQLENLLKPLILLIIFLLQTVTAGEFKTIIEKGVSDTPLQNGWKFNNPVKTFQFQDYATGNASLKITAGYGKAALITISLRKYNSDADSMEEFTQKERWTGTGLSTDQKILSAPDDIGDKRIMYETVPKPRSDGKPQGRPTYWIHAVKGVWYLRLSHSHRLDESLITDNTAKETLKNLARNIMSQLESKNTLLPIIFLPGVAGTQLYDNTLGIEQEIWPIPPNAWEIRRLNLSPQGVPLDTGVFPQDILRSAIPKLYPLVPQIGIYDSLMKFIQTIEFEDGNGYIEDKNLFAWGYDWRLDNAEHVEKLNKYVDNLCTRLHTKKVILIGHSMGGLISRAFAAKYPAKIETVISIGSPFAGSPKPFFGLVMGYTFGNRFVTDMVMKIMLQNAPAAYQLLPQYPFILDTEADFREMRNQDVYHHLRYTNSVEGGNTQSLNKMLLERAKPFYQIVGTAFAPVPLPSSVNHYAIIGYGVNTLAGFVMRSALDSDATYLEYAGKKVILDPYFGDGDGTVPLKSANIANTTRTYFIKHEESGFYLSGKHGDLPNNSVVQGIVSSILRGFPFRITGSPNPNSLIEGESGADFTLRSDANLTIRDRSSAKILGFNDNGEIEENLAGTFLVMNGHEFASVSGTKESLSVQVKGLRDGKFSLDITTHKNGLENSFSYKEVAVHRGTLAKLELTPTNSSKTQLPTMKVMDGTGSRTVVPIPNTPLSHMNQYDIPTLKAQVTDIQFFGSGNDILPKKERVYKSSFNVTNSKYINWELALSHPAPAKRTPFKINGRFINPKGELFGDSWLDSYVDSNWIDSTHATGWGWNEPGHWMPGTYTVEICVDGKTIKTGHFDIVSEKGTKGNKDLTRLEIPGTLRDIDSPEIMRFVGLKPDIHLIAAGFLWTKHKSAAEKKDDSHALDRLREVEDQIDEASRQYEFYLTGDRVYLTPQWKQHYNKMQTDPNAPQLNQTPLSILAHLHIARESMYQTIGQIQVQSVQFTQLQSDQLQALRKAAAALDQAVHTMGVNLGRKLYSADARGLFIEIPDTYSKNKTSYTRPVSVTKNTVDGTPLATIFIDHVDTDYECTPQELFAKQINLLKEKFPDLHSQVLEFSSGSGYELKAQYSYQYNWKGDPIKARVFVSKQGQKAVMLSYLALGSEFSDEEIGQIVGSMHFIR